MAAHPGPETTRAFEEATLRLSSLEAQSKALTDRLMLTAETAVEEAASAAEAVGQRAFRIGFSQTA